MISYYAHIENDIVTSVEVVTDEFFNANPNRYKGLWLKVGEGSNRPFCGVGNLYLKDRDVCVPKPPYSSWVLNENHEWEAPVKRPEGIYCVWNEDIKAWVVVNPIIEE